MGKDIKINEPKIVYYIKTRIDNKYYYSGPYINKRPLKNNQKLLVYNLILKEIIKNKK